MELKKALAALACLLLTVGMFASPFYAMSITQLPDVQAYDTEGRDPFETHGELSGFRDVTKPLLTFAEPKVVAHLWGRLNGLNFWGITLALVLLHLRVRKLPELENRHGGLESGGFWIALVGVVLTAFGNALDYWIYFDQRNFLQGLSWPMTIQGLVIYAAGLVLVGVGLKKVAFVPRWVRITFMFLSLAGYFPYLGYMAMLQSLSKAGLFLAVPFLGLFLLHVAAWWKLSLILWSPRRATTA